jgi:hypothetical protein
MTQQEKPPYLYALAAAAAVFALYVITLAPTTAFWDTSEYIASSHIMGIAHPPGNPLFVILARSWDVLLSPFPVSVAVRINLFSAAMSALAHGCWFLVAHRVLRGCSDNPRFRLLGAAAAVMCSAAAFTVWNQSNVNEKVYTVSLFTIALLVWIMFRWRDAVPARRNDRLLVLVAFLLALSVGNHLMAVLAAPALLAFVLATRPAVLLDWRLYPHALAAAALGLSVLMFLPIRAELNPIVNQANPRCTSIGEAAISVFTLGHAGCTTLSESLTRKQYGKPSMFSDPVAAPERDLPRSPAFLGAQIANYLQYFDWQWARSVRGNNGWFGGFRPLVTLLFLMIGMYGARANYRVDRQSFAMMTVLMLTLSLGLVFYLNFKYGYSSPWADALHRNTEVRERDYFFVVGFSVWGVWSGIGLAALWQRYRTPVFLSLALIPLCANWTWASRANDYVARDWSYNLLMSVEPYGVLVTNGDNDTFPLWYLQEVEGVRQDVTVIVMSYMNTAWYAKQLRDLTARCERGQTPAADRTRIICQRPFVPPAGTDLYATSDAAPGSERVSDKAMFSAGTGKPHHSILDLSDERIDGLALTAFISDSATYTAGSLTTKVARGTEIYPADIFLAQIIKSSIEDRPIYFAITSPAYETLGLTDHLVQRGVAYKLVNGPVSADPVRGIYEIPNAGGSPRFIDVPMTEQLVSKVFVQHDGFPDRWKHWTDAATQATPLFFANPWRLLAIVYAVQGDTVRAMQLAGQAERFERVANIRATEAARFSKPTDP